MRAHEFEYARVGEKEYPLIPITLESNGLEITTLALIDSGATISVFRSEIAEALEMNWRTGEGILLQSANAKFAAYMNRIKASIGDEELNLDIAARAHEVPIRGCIIDPKNRGRALFLVEEQGVPYVFREAAITSHPGVVKGLSSMFGLRWRYESEEPALSEPL